MRVSPQQKRSNGATTFGGSCQQNPSAMWFLTLSKSPHIFKPAQEWMLADSNLITDLCAVWKRTHTHTHTVRFSCLIAFHENTHAHSPTHNRHMQKSISAQEVSLQTTPKSVPSDSDTMMMTLPWQRTPQVSCSSGVRALNALDGIFKWWKPFEKQSISWVTLLLPAVLPSRTGDWQIALQKIWSNKRQLQEYSYRNIQYKLNSIKLHLWHNIKKS